LFLAVVFWFTFHVCCAAVATGPVVAVAFTVCTFTVVLPLIFTGFTLHWVVTFARFALLHAVVRFARLRTFVTVFVYVAFPYATLRLVRYLRLYYVYALFCWFRTFDYTTPLRLTHRLRLRLVALRYVCLRYVFFPVRYVVPVARYGCRYVGYVRVFFYVFLRSLCGCAREQLCGFTAACCVRYCYVFGLVAVGCVGRNVVPVFSSRARLPVRYYVGLHTLTLFRLPHSRLTQHTFTVTCVRS